MVHVGPSSLNASQHGALAMLRAAQISRHLTSTADADCRDPAPWTAAQQRKQQAQWLLRLSPAHVAELDTASQRILAAGSAPDLTSLTRADFPLPTLGPLLVRVRGELLHGRGFALLRGIPVERYSREQSVVVFLGLGLHVGDPVSQNDMGHLIGHVCDHGDAETAGPGSSVRVYRTRRRQRFHTDSCDIVGLLCLHPAAAGGASHIASSLAARERLARVRPDLHDALEDGSLQWDRKGEVDFRVPDPAKRAPFYRGAVFNRHEGRSFCIYDRNFLQGCERHALSGGREISLRAREACDALEALCESDELRLDMSFEQGDVQLLCNHTILHARGAYDDHDDPKRRRHLLRLWLSVPPEHGAPALPPSYVDGRYSSIDGPIRGGIHIRPGYQLQVPMVEQ